MGFSPYSQVVKPAEWVDPLNLDVYAKGMAYKQEMAEKNLQLLSNAYNSLFSIDAYGPDKRKLAEIDDQFRQQVSSMNFSDLGNMQTMSQINNLISEFSSNPQVLSIAQRTSFKDQEEKKMEEARKKGRTYKNRNYDRLMQYYNGEDFIEKPESFSLSSGYVIPEIQKKQDAITKANTRQVAELGSDGRIRTYNKIDGNKAQQQWVQAINNDPELAQYYRDTFEDEYEGTDWDQKGKEMLAQARNTALELAANSTGETKQEYEQKAKRYEDAINSNYTGSYFKNIAFQEFVDNEANNFGNSINALDLKDIKADQFDLNRIRYNQQREMAKYKEGLKRETEDMKREAEAGKPSKDAIRTDRLKKAAAKGIAIVDPNSPDGYISNEELDRLGIKEPETPKELKDKTFSLQGIKESFRNNEEGFKKAIETKLGEKAGYGFDINDIEDLSWDNESKTYKLKLDTEYFDEEFKLTKEELNDFLNEVNKTTSEETEVETTTPSEETTTETPSTEEEDFEQYKRK